MRREWIEIAACAASSAVLLWSPSMRREWIEIGVYGWNWDGYLSPSMRREWIEIAG